MKYNSMGRPVKKPMTKRKMAKGAISKAMKLVDKNSKNIKAIKIKIKMGNDRKGK